MMKKVITMIVLALLLIQVTAAGFASTVYEGSTEEDKGSLVIVGGALEQSNGPVYERFVELAKRKGPMKIGIIPAASTKPSKYGNLFKKDLVEVYGVPESAVVVLPIALRDDSTTDDIDESLWKENGSHPDVVASLADLTGIWFVGGDQTRITEVLFTESGQATPALEAITALYRQGAVLGGTSAGAAIMSDVMLTGGDSLGALTSRQVGTYESMDDQESGALTFEKGFGWFPGGIVDQHFDRKARLGRLIIANQLHKAAYPMGFGVDENTAMVYDAQTKTIESVGRGGVTIVDVTEAEETIVAGMRRLMNVRISFIEGYDQYSVETGEYKINPDKLDTVGYEYLYVPDPMVTGVMSRNGYYKQMLGFDLVDNEAADKVVSYAYGQNGVGYQLTFRQEEDTTGWWAYLDGMLDHYSALNVYLDLEPVVVTAAPVAQATYTVQAGDVLWQIARDHQVDMTSLIQANGLAHPDKIHIGQGLIIPAK